MTCARRGLILLLLESPSEYNPRDSGADASVAAGIAGKNQRPQPTHDPSLNPDSRRRIQASGKVSLEQMGRLVRIPCCDLAQPSSG